MSDEQKPLLDALGFWLNPLQSYEGHSANLRLVLQAASDEITRLRAQLAKLSDPALVDVLYNALVENGCCFSEDDLVPALTAIRRHLGLEKAQ